MSVKSRHRRRYISILCFWVLISINCMVIGDPADRYFEIGVRAAQKQQYQVALKAFVQAKSAGLDSPELHYNLGVVYYKLERFDKAASNFKRLIQNPEYSAVAFYNLGLVDLKQGKTGTAKDWFLKASSNTKEPTLKKLSELALQRVNVDGASRPSVFSGWNGFVTAAGGYDTNVALIDEDVSQTRGITDYHQELTAVASRMLWGTLDKGIQFTANADILDQQTQHGYDFSQWHMGLTQTGAFYGWKTSGAVGVDRLRFSNAAFQQLTTLEFRGVRGISKLTALEVGYGYVNIEDQSPNGIYHYLEGNLHQIHLKLTDKVKNVGLKYLYEIQLNNRVDYRIFSSTTAGNISTETTTTQSYSPLRNIFQVTADVPLAEKLALILGAQYRYSYYSDADTKQVVTTDSTSGAVESTSESLQREDHRFKVNLGMQYSYNADWQFFSYYSYTKNNSNKPGSNYRRSLLSAGVSWFF